MRIKGLIRIMAGVLGVCIMPTQADVADVFAGAAATYGTDTVATMYSATQTVGLATFQISIDVDPLAGGGVRSLGDSSWGIDSTGETGGNRFTFDGATGESVDSIANIQVINFDAGGGSLTLGDITDLSFKSITIKDGQHSNDRVKIIAGGVTNAAVGLKMSSASEAVDLQLLAGSSLVSSFTVENGTTAGSNRWGVNSVQVSYNTIPEPATLGMIGVCGVGVLFIRRRFMM